MSEIFPAKSIFTAYRKCKSLKELHLTNNKVHPPDSIDPMTQGCRKCLSSKCDLCSYYLEEGDKFMSIVTKKSYKIIGNVNCNSKGVIYLATCTICNVQYVGSTATPFKVRFRNHKSDMKNNRSRCELAVHFNSKAHRLEQIRFMVIEQILNVSNLPQILTKREAYWMAQLCTSHPHGLNKRKEFNSYKRVCYL